MGGISISSLVTIVLGFIPVYLVLLVYFTKDKQARTQRIIVGLLLSIFFPFNLFYLAYLGGFVRKGE